MKKIITLILIFSFSFLIRNEPANAQAPIVLHDTGDYLTEVEVVKPKRSLSPQSRVSNKKTKIIVTRPILKPSKILAKPNKPVSMAKDYQPKMQVTKTITKNPPKSITSKTIVSKPAYIPSQVSNKKYPDPRVNPARRPIIVIDPGHGGKDRGTAGTLGTKEKDLTLAYSLALKRALDRTGKYKVVLTRYDDRFVELPQRVSFARKAGGDVLISIHADSNPNKTTKGFSIYTLSAKRRSSEAEKLLAMSDKQEVVRGANLRKESKDVKEAIIGFAQDSTKEVSDDFAKTVAKSLGRRIQALPKHNREGSLAVLTGADIPAVLIELGYLSNQQEERLLKREDHKQKIVTSITNAINEYFSKFNMVF